MKKSIILTSLVLGFLAMPNSYAFSKASQPLEMQRQQAQSADPYRACRGKLRRAGHLTKGKGAKSKNHLAIDACVRNGGRI